jgi:hypothetical protein
MVSVQHEPPSEGRKLISEHRGGLWLDALGVNYVLACNTLGDSATGAAVPLMPIMFMCTGTRSEIASATL